MKISPTLQEALALRSAYKLPQALAKLEEACKLNEPDALFMKAMALIRGGWGLLHNWDQAIYYLTLSVQLGYHYAITYDDYDEIPTTQEDIDNLNPIVCTCVLIGRISCNLKNAQELNDAQYWFKFGVSLKNLNEKIYALKKAADQKHTLAIKELYRISKTTETVKYLILGKCYYYQEDVLRNLNDRTHEHLIGREIHMDNLHPLRNSDLGKKAVTFYLKNIKASEMEVITWLLISKCLRHPRDTSKLIALEIWRLRDEIWF
jgi:TPR repeat protein